MNVHTKYMLTFSPEVFIFTSPVLILSLRGLSLHSYHPHTSGEPASDTYNKSVEIDLPGLYVMNPKHSKLASMVFLRSHRLCYPYSSQGESIRAADTEMNVATLEIGLELGLRLMFSVMVEV